MHRVTNSQFGLDQSNFIGSLPQSNKYHATWGEFLIQERLEPQLRLAIDRGYFPPREHHLWEKVWKVLEKLFPDESPTLLHGDLWGGNWLQDQAGQTWFIDPAIYYGHREMDLAMTRLFGGFSAEFYDTYESNMPLAPGWQKRLYAAQLYYILVHVNLFGSPYIHQAIQMRNYYL